MSAVSADQAASMSAGAREPTPIARAIALRQRSQTESPG
jgi:hypothetical protein